jgi:transcriptional regulator with XRE-family HTH domain
MPASKQAHVLALLRSQLSLKQTELADMVGCSVETVRAIELNRLKLSPSLAGRISTATGADLAWLLDNDLTRPLPAIRTLATQNPLIDQFRKLFAAARMTVQGPELDALTLYVAWELNELKKARTLTEPPGLAEAEAQFLAGKPPAQKALPSPPKAPRRTRASI